MCWFWWVKLASYNKKTDCRKKLYLLVIGMLHVGKTLGVPSVGVGLKGSTLLQFQNVVGRWLVLVLEFTLWVELNYGGMVCKIPKMDIQYTYVYKLEYRLYSNKYDQI